MFLKSTLLFVTWFCIKRETRERVDWQRILCLKYCEIISYKNVLYFSDISPRTIKSYFIVLEMIHKHWYTVCHKNCSKEGIVHYAFQNMTFMSCPWLLPECFLMKEKMCVCVFVCVCLCVRTIRGCVTEKETITKKCSLLSPEVFIFLLFKEQRPQPLLPVRGKAEVYISSNLERNQQHFLRFFSFLASSQMRIWDSAVQNPLPFEIKPQHFRMKVEGHESVPRPAMLAQISLICLKRF